MANIRQNARWACQGERSSKNSLKTPTMQSMIRTFFFHAVAPLERFMAEDLVLEWQNVLRDSITDQHPDVNDLLLLELATKFGAVDPYSKDPVSRHYRKPTTVTEKQILTILDGLQAQFRDIKIDPMTQSDQWRLLPSSRTNLSGEYANIPLYGGFDKERCSAVVEHR